MIEYEVIEREDLIMISSTDEAFDTINVSLRNFWAWVISNEINAYCTDYYDPSQRDGHGQMSGYLSMEEYLDMDYKTIKKDLIKYLQFKNLIK